ncbi:collagen alpha-1(I) chain-like [Mesoplodon densirostris]|uniref:collagen alpha-1(I) chain-like n=1 Tax=Mesoplodon densirostris TaxID=48708 RepID=UPI0028DCA3DF|nr:collagen alpha-1(I) chain-like [Mesoplodon densirostris]
MESGRGPGGFRSRGPRSLGHPPRPAHGALGAAQPQPGPALLPGSSWPEATGSHHGGRGPGGFRSRGPRSLGHPPRPAHGALGAAQPQPGPALLPGSSWPEATGSHHGGRGPGGFRSRGPRSLGHPPRPAHGALGAAQPQPGPALLPGSSWPEATGSHHGVARRPAPPGSAPPPAQAGERRPRGRGPGGFRSRGPRSLGHPPRPAHGALGAAQPQPGPALLPGSSWPEATGSHHGVARRPVRPGSAPPPAQAGERRPRGRGPGGFRSRGPRSLGHPPRPAHGALGAAQPQPGPALLPGSSWPEATGSHHGGRGPGGFRSRGPRSLGHPPRPAHGALGAAQPQPGPALLPGSSWPEATGSHHGGRGPGGFRSRGPRSLGHPPRPAHGALGAAQPQPGPALLPGSSWPEATGSHHGGRGPGGFRSRGPRSLGHPPRPAHGALGAAQPQPGPALLPGSSWPEATGSHHGGRGPGGFRSRGPRSLGHPPRPAHGALGAAQPQPGPALLPGSSWPEATGSHHGGRGPGGFRSRGPRSLGHPPRPAHGALGAAQPQPGPALLPGSSWPEATGSHHGGRGPGGFRSRGPRSLGHPPRPAHGALGAAQPQPGPALLPGSSWPEATGSHHGVVPPCDRMAGQPGGTAPSGALWLERLEEVWPAVVLGVG